METCHLINSSSYVICSHCFESVNLASNNRKVNTEETSEEPVTESNLIDLYAGRLKADKWKNKNTYASVYGLLNNMTLADFMGKKEVRISANKSVVSLFSPNVSSDPNRPDIWRYAYVTLMKLKPWTSFPESVFDGEKGSIKILSTVNEDVKSQIIHSFKAYFRDYI